MASKEGDARLWLNAVAIATLLLVAGCNRRTAQVAPQRFSEVQDSTHQPTIALIDCNSDSSIWRSTYSNLRESVESHGIRVIEQDSKSTDTEQLHDALWVIAPDGFLPRNIACLLREYASRSLPTILFYGATPGLFQERYEESDEFLSSFGIDVLQGVVHQAACRDTSGSAEYSAHVVAISMDDGSVPGRPHFIRSTPIQLLNEHAAQIDTLARTATPCIIVKNRESVGNPSIFPLILTSRIVSKSNQAEAVLFLSCDTIGLSDQYISRRSELCEQIARQIARILRRA